MVFEIRYVWLNGRVITTFILLAAWFFPSSISLSQPGEFSTNEFLLKRVSLCFSRAATISYHIISETGCVDMDRNNLAKAKAPKARSSVTHDLFC